MVIAQGSLTQQEQELQRARSLAQDKRRKFFYKFVIYATLLIFGLFFAFPLFWTASSSLQTWQELRSFEPHLFPRVPQWNNYVEVFTVVPFARWMLNSLIITVINIGGILVTCTITAYAFARFDFIGKNIWFTLMLSTMMLPFVVTLIPQYLLFFQLKLVNTYVPLTIGSWLGSGGHAAIMIFMMRQFILGIPRDLDEAARIDGANPFQILILVIVPLLKPALITAVILTFLRHWNNFFGPFIYLNDQELFTAAVGLRFFQYIPMDTADPRDHLLMAAAAIMTLPVLILFVAAQRYFVSAVVMTGLKE